MFGRLDALYPYTREEIAARLAAVRERDPVGDRMHAAFGMAWCFLATWPTTVVEFAGLPLIVIFLLRLPKLWRVLPMVFLQPLFLLVLAFVLWQTVAIAWSPDPWNGLEEVGANRWAWSLIALWPVIERRRWFIGALAAGFLLGHVTQVVHGLGVHFDVEWMQWDRKPHRNSGWWRPVVSGSILAGALGLHLPVALMGRGRWRLVGIAGSLVTMLGLLATGTRGGWIAGAGLVVVVGAVAAVTARRRRRSLAPLAVALALTAAAGAVAWMAIGESVQRRFEAGVREVTGAIEHKRFRTDTGARLLMWWWAAEALSERPLTGIGTGGYRAWTIANLERQGIDPSERNLHSHAHSASFHIAATTGLIGLAIAVMVAVVAVRGAFKGLPPPGLEWYDAGPGFALIGMLLAGTFDPVHLNSQSGAHLAILLSLSLWPRPSTALPPDPTP